MTAAKKKKTPFGRAMLLGVIEKYVESQFEEDFAQLDAAERIRLFQWMAGMTLAKPTGKEPAPVADDDIYCASAAVRNALERMYGKT